MAELATTQLMYSQRPGRCAGGVPAATSCQAVQSLLCAFPGLLPQELKESGYDQQQIDASRAATHAQMQQLRAAAMGAKAGQQQEQESAR